MPATVGDHRRGVGGLIKARVPDRFSGHAIVSGQARVRLPGRRDDHEVPQDQRRAAHAVERHAAAELGDDIPRPHHVPRPAVETVEDPRAANRIHPPVVDGRRTPRPRSAHPLVPRLVFVGRLVRVLPHFLAGRELAADDAFVVAALLLREGVTADDRKAAPARPDRLAPQLARRMLGPLRIQLHVREHARSCRPLERGKIRLRIGDQLELGGFELAHGRLDQRIRFDARLEREIDARVPRQAAGLHKTG